VKLSVLLSAIAIGGLAASANAADLGGPSAYGPYNAPSTSAPLIANFFDGAAPGSITVAGITVYGTVDFSVAYNSHGAPVTGTLYQGAPYQVQKFSGAGRWTATDNAMSQSFIGVKTNEKLSDLLGMDSLSGWSFISDAQIGFDPAWADISDACKTRVLNNGVATLSQTANYDGSRCGQLFNGTLYAGLKNKDFGQLTYGRHNSLLNDALSANDPEAGSYAFSFFAFSGTVGGGAGDTEDARWNNSLRYSNTIADIFRVAAMGRFGGAEQGGTAYSVSGGVDVPGPFKGLSVDAVYGHFNDAITVSSLGAGDTVGGPGTPTCGDIGAACQNLNVLKGTISDDEVWAIMGKYNLAHFGLDTVTAMGGYENFRLNNPNDPLRSPYTTIGGYDMFSLTQTKYATANDVDVYWLGAKWAVTPKLTAAAVWYHEDSNTFASPTIPTCVGGRKADGTVATAGNCAGTQEWVGMSLDYQWTKRLDLYAGISYSEVAGGLASGFTNTDTWNPAFGARFRF
jgi:predicted porin